MVPKLIKNISKITLSFFILFPICVFSQSQGKEVYQKADSLQEINTYQKADSLHDKAQKIEAFKNFVSAYPNSQYKANAFMELFSLYLNTNEVKAALKYADSTVQSAPVQLKIAVYNDVAYSLAQKKVGLDTAIAYAQKAVSESKGNVSTYVKYTGMFIETQALVMYDLGKVDSALELEKVAITFDMDNPEFLSNLAIYQEAAGHRLEGLKIAAKAIFFGNAYEALTNFNKWIEKEKPDKKGQKELRKVIADSTLKSFFEKSKKDNKYRVNSTAAAFLACLRVNINQANIWIKESINSLNDNSEITDRILFTKNYALTLLAEGKDKEALNVLNSVENLVDPRDVNFWYILGKTYVKVKEYQKALDSYITGSIFMQPLSLQTALKELRTKEVIRENKIGSLIVQKRNDFSSFEPGHYKGTNTKSNVMLAELFTSVECKPCACADYAFENLSQYFTKDEVAILEYHLNISGFDAMSNPDTFGRYAYYGSNFGMPTVFIQGTARVDGGGPKALTENRFNIYKYILEKFLNKDSNVKLSGSVKQVNDSISINLQIKNEKIIKDNVSLHIALTEKSIQHPADNGVTKHIFVVRNLFKGAEGTPIELNKAKEKVSAVFNVKEIEKGLTKYLSDPTKDPSWTEAFLSHRKKWMNNLDRSNLAVVAWLQDNKTKEVLQTIYLDVPSNNISKSNK